MKEEKILKTNVMRILDQKKINYTIYTYPHDDEAVDGATVAELIGRDPNMVYKTLVTKSTHKNNMYYVFVIPVLKSLDLKKAAKIVNEKGIEMIAVKDLLQLTGYVRGGCSPIGMKKQFSTVFSDDLNTLSSVIFSAGKIGFQVEISPLELKKVVPYKIADITE